MTIVYTFDDFYRHEIRVCGTYTFKVPQNDGVDENLFNSDISYNKKIKDMYYNEALEEFALKCVCDMSDTCF